MKRTIIGTRITTECGHSWKLRRITYSREDFGGATADCRRCGELLLISREQFLGQDPQGIPANVHCSSFHKEINRQDPDWPADGRETYSVGFLSEMAELPPEKPCRTCGSTNTKPYETKPPVKHNGPCTPECIVKGRLCLNCRMFHPGA